MGLTFQTNPSGLKLVVGSTQATAPFTRTVIVGSTNSVIAPTPQTTGGLAYVFDSWSDGGAQTHNIVAGAQPSTYTAAYKAQESGACTISGTTANDTLTGTSGDDVICGGGGADTIRGLRGNDTLSGGEGADRLDGGHGVDTAHGNAGNDSVTEGRASDRLFGEGGDDTVNSKDGTSGNDSLDGGPHLNGDTAVTDRTEKSIVEFP